MRFRRTPEGLLLENIIRNGTEAPYLFCWNGSEHDGGLWDSGPFDCACAMTFPDEEMWSTCGCTCHVRFEEMCENNNVKLWLRAMILAEKSEDQKILPPFPKNHEEKVHLGKNLYNKHWGDRSLAMGPCPCDHCDYVRSMDPDWAREKDEMAEMQRQDAIKRFETLEASRAKE